LLALILAMKLLLIDDDEAITTVLTTAFNKAGFETVVSHTGEEGVSKAGADNFDIILLDQVLTDISGNEVLRILKNDEKTKNIPVLILSNFSQRELVDQALELGAVDYVFKYQVEPSDIIAKIKRLTENPPAGGEPKEN
jgi:DNA-binding response OmpR family regulator